jgi:hypothetical protein
MYCTESTGLQVGHAEPGPALSCGGGREAENLISLLPRWIYQGDLRPLTAFIASFTDKFGGARPIATGSGASAFFVDATIDLGFTPGGLMNRLKVT